MFRKSVPELFKKFPRRQPNTTDTDSSQSIYPCKHGARILPRGRKITTILEDHFVSVDGVKIRYLEEGSGPTVVLIHGFGVSAETWRHNIPSLASKSRVLAPDLVGHGKSDRPDDAPYSMRYYVDSLQTFLKLTNAQKPTLLGHSMGGLIAMRIALEDAANETRALVLEDSAGLGGGPSLGTRLSFLSYLLRMSLLGSSESRVRGWLKKSFYNDPSKISDEAVKRALDTWKDPDYRRVQRKTAMGMRKSERKTSWFIKQIPVQTLILWGEEDKQIPPKVAYRAARKIENCKVEVIPNCGHAPHSECPEEFNRRVLAFLDGLS